MSDAMMKVVLEAIDGQRADMRNLIHGLRLLAESIGAMSDTLNTLVETASEEPAEDNPTAAALRQLAAAVQKNTAGVAVMREAMIDATLRAPTPLTG